MCVQGSTGVSNGDSLSALLTQIMNSISKDISSGDWQDAMQSGEELFLALLLEEMMNPTSTSDGYGYSGFPFSDYSGTSILSNSGSGSSSGQPVSNSGSNEAILQKTAAEYGWGSGPQWQALVNVENAEAGFSSTAENPSSGALGLAQALGHGDANTAGTLGNQYGGYGLTDAQAKAANSGNAADQALWMLNYIKSRYGSPEAAWQHEETYHWY